jgi:hypothetical protein
VGCSNQLNHNTHGNGDGTTTNKLQRGGKTNHSNVLNLASTHFFSLAKAPLIAKMARVAINKRRMKKRHKKSMEA